ncbi:MAG: hypothetical protein PHW60_09710 [Kiritimatiellae bacterium]|nr:hypothetical protein [Kiritimatiellia bacterium]
MNTSGVAWRYRAAWRRLLPALLLCGALVAAAAEKQAAPTVRTATFVVAAADSPAQSRAQADYVCPGRDDHLVINTALDALPTAGGQRANNHVGGVLSTATGMIRRRASACNAMALRGKASSFFAKKPCSLPQG